MSDPGSMASLELFEGGFNLNSEGFSHPVMPPIRRGLGPRWAT